MRHLYYVLLLLALFGFGCAPATIQPMELGKATFEKTPEFDGSTVVVTKPEAPNPIPLTKKGEVTTASKADYIAFTLDDFKKISALSLGFNVQQEVIQSLVVLVNTHIAEINALKELMATKEEIAQMLAELYANEQNMRLSVEHEAWLQGWTDKGVMAILLGIISALAW